MKKTIAFIGFDEQAASFILRLLGKGYPILLTENDNSPALEVFQAKVLSEFAGSQFEVVNCSKECAWESDVIVLNVASEAVPKLSAKIKNVITGKILITLKDVDYFEVVKGVFPLVKTVWLNGNEIFADELIAIEKVSEIIN
jgi:predicted dinucleotide-binding enzyme